MSEIKEIKEKKEIEKIKKEIDKISIKLSKVEEERLNTTQKLSNLKLELSKKKDGSKIRQSIEEKIIKSEIKLEETN
jgi:chorismate mutase